MRNEKFIKESGYIHDLFFLFVLYFNKEYCLTHFINYDKSSEDTDYFNSLLVDFLPISDELLPFFYLRDDQKSFITQFYYEPYKNEFVSSYSLSAVQTVLLDYNQVIGNLIKFYFPNIDNQMLEECKNSITAVGKFIKNSKYNSDLKSSLYAFFLEPIPVIQKLSYELMAKEFVLSQKYEKSFRHITELQHQIDVKKLIDKLAKCNLKTGDFSSFDDIYISFCILNKNCVKSHYYDNKAILLLGADFEDYIDYIIGESTLPELNVFGNALAERNRIEILDLIVSKGEITIRDIEQELGFTGTNAYYHLSLMIKAKVIRSRNQGRTIIYSINKNYFDIVCDMLSKYSNKPKGGKFV
ncbi:winged helix-turn-helix domain-containing protein [Pseudoruminococcus massiliensis]|uniref:ArsR/SmtB family transcription factor n=1 Tax=Pseudoruminococcus massiliensis TaxID=2086583 RepID=UPI00307C3DC0